MTKDNHLLGKFDLTGIPPAPRGIPQIEVTFEIDANGILQVSAEDKGTGNREKIVITNDQNRLTPDDIERMIKDAERFADDDKKLKEKVEARNELESYAYSLKNQLQDKEKLGSKVYSFLTIYYYVLFIIQSDLIIKLNLWDIAAGKWHSFCSGWDVNSGQNWYWLIVDFNICRFAELGIFYLDFVFIFNNL